MKSVDENNNRYRKACTDNPFCPPKHFVKAATPNSIDVLFVDYDTMTVVRMQKHLDTAIIVIALSVLNFIKRTESKNSHQEGWDL